MKLKPRTNRVLIRPLAPPTQTASGLHVVEHKKPEQIGTVIACGSETRELEVGETVLFSWQSGQEIILDADGTRVLVMLERDVLAVIGQGVEIEANEPILA